MGELSLRRPHSLPIRTPGMSVLPVVLGSTLAAVAGHIGADSRWAAALGSTIARHRSIPDGVPFAAARSAGWHNVPVLAEVVFAGVVSAAGDRGLVLLQVAGVGLALELLRRTMIRAGSTELATAVALSLIAVGAFGELVIVRLQVFSVPLFAALLFFLYRARDRPLRALLWMPLFFALWSNLHGAVLVGLAVLTSNLLLDRGRRDGGRALLLLGACATAICLTPAGPRTPLYYLHVARSVAAERGIGLWQPLSLRHALHLSLIVCGLVAIALAFRGRLRPWELATVVLLIASTLHTARTGVWLLMFLAIPAARGIRSRKSLGGLPVAAITALLVVLLGAAVREGPAPSGASSRIVDRAIFLARGTPILADDVVAEQIALAGGRVWISDPLDAFPRVDQELYLNWSAGRADGLAAVDHAPRVVVVSLRSPPARTMGPATGFHLAAGDARVAVYVRSTRRVEASRTSGRH